MFDRLLLPVTSRLLAPPARLLAAAGVPADTITLVGFGFGLLASGLTALHRFDLALLAFALNRILDGLDGAVARRTGPTDRGAFLDIALDFFVYAALPAAILLLSFVGTGSSFLAFAVIAERRGLASTAYPQKGIFYLGGLTEGSETIACFTAMLLWPAWFPALAWTFATLCALTTLTRWLWGWRTFSPPRT